MPLNGPKLIAGLGNPGPEYADTRHNVGFWFVDAMARERRLTFRPELRFAGALCRLETAAHRCWLFKPGTYMNDSGRALVAVMQYYDIAPDALLVAHDDIDLLPGQVRLKSGGGHGGHNGLRDVIQHLGSSGFHRLRIGIGHPGHRDHVVPYVLGRPSAEDRLAIEEGIGRALAVMPGILDGGYEKVMNELHRPEPQSDPEG